MSNGRLLWVDDEIAMMRAQIFFLESKGYEVCKASNGADAIDLCQEQSFDLIQDASAYRTHRDGHQE